MLEDNEISLIDFFFFFLSFLPLKRRHGVRVALSSSGRFSNFLPDKSLDEG